jgi:hypothetical protein
MKLFHFKEAKKCALYINKLRPDFIKGYVFLGQSVYFKKEATYEEIEDTLKTIKNAFNLATKQEDINNLTKIEELL